MTAKKEYKTSADFLPFIFEDLETKNNLLNTARTLKDKTGVENLLASTLIFASLTEYLAQHLLQNLRYLVYRASYLRLNAVVFIDQTDRDQTKGLGETIKALTEFEFPDKQNVIKLLNKFNKSRNHFFHEFMKINNQNGSKFDLDIKIIRECTEDFIDKLNTIYPGLGAMTWDAPQAEDTTSKSSVGKNKKNGA